MLVNLYQLRNQGPLVPVCTSLVSGNITIMYMVHISINTTRPSPSTKHQTKAFYYKTTATYTTSSRVRVWSLMEACANLCQTSCHKEPTCLQAPAPSTTAKTAKSGTIHTNPSSSTNKQIKTTPLPSEINLSNSLRIKDQCYNQLRLKWHSIKTSQNQKTSRLPCHWKDNQSTLVIGRETQVYVMK